MKTTEPMTLKQIAKAEGVSHQMIALILERALRKFKAGLAAKGITLKDLI